jgi:uncharacterized protein (DUF1684 family)
MLAGFAGTPVLQGTMRRAAPALIAVLATLACRRPPAVDPTYLPEVDAARARRLSELTAGDGWLTLVARELLSPGENVVGSEPSAAVVLEAPGIPAKACVFDLRPDGTVVVRAEAGAPVAVNGTPPTAAPLVPEREGQRHDVVTVGRVRLSLFEKDGRILVRARDSESPRRTGFTGLTYFAIDPGYRVEAAYEAYAAPREVDVPSSRGPARKALAPGVVRFTLAGREHRLEPTVEAPEDDTLFFVFSDATAGTETYGGGRFLHARRPKPGESKVVLDFNLAENPPCSLTPYASCPLALPRNTLPVRIEAGEKAPRGH